MGIPSSGGFIENVEVRDIGYRELREARSLFLGGTHVVHYPLKFLCHLCGRENSW